MSPTFPVYLCQPPSRKAIEIARLSRQPWLWGSHVFVSVEISITNASHAICSIVAGGINPESTPVEIASAGSVHDETCGFSTESAALVGESFTLDLSTATSPPPLAVPSRWCLGTPGPLVPPDGVPSLLVQLAPLPGLPVQPD